ncbi:hypothetical protein [Streptomyces sp. NRRL S-920]|uniref:hypothetical protein n=1 Tax=Streptomyces sp. NRRL S-920 TaxID=1463921 RepID=UPI000A805BE4|nr:hypothetical protein [Streptomyces sp. NRRL S-920]
MITFVAGLALGGLSGGLTFAATADGQLAAIVGAVVMVLCWVGVAAVVVLDD